jgi:hypothetical protein
MPNDRRRFLVASAAGLAALLMPKLSFAGLFHRRCRRVVPTTCATPVYPTSSMNCHATPCQLAGINWYTSTPAVIPDSSHITVAPAQHQISVNGTGLMHWAQNGGSFYPGVQDNNNSNAVWTPTGVQSLIPDNGNGYDTLNFWVTETGSTAGNTDSITITITLSSGTCRGSWTQPVTYA